ncbi:MAG: hypothetical protein ACU84J_13060 [Gammaproteobacteria bacterium]
MKPTTTLLLLLSLVAPPGSGAADEILIVTGRDTPVTALTLRELKRIFLKEIQFGNDGVKWIPVNLNSNHPCRLAFSLDLFDKRPEEQELYWNSQYFKGISPPYVVGSQEAMASFVAETPGAIGYLFPCHLNEQLKIVARINIESSTPAACTP